MPPPIEEEEELEIEHETSGDESDEMIDLEALDEMEGFKPVNRAPDQGREPRWQQEDDRPRRQPSPILVVSDIVRNKARAVADNAVPNRVSLPALAPSPSETENINGKKRKRRRLDLQSNQDPLAKRRRGRKRDVCCIQCVRKLAKDPHWACHDALVGQSGRGNYTGFRCSECVGGHTPCQLIPSGAKDAVQLLQRAAANYVASQGTDKIPLLAKYEKASEFALQAIASVSAKQETYYKKKPKSQHTSADKVSAAPQHRENPATSGRASSHGTPATDYAYHHNSNRDSNSRSFSAGQPYQQYQDGAPTDPGMFNHAQQQQQQQQQQPQLPGQHDYQEQQHHPQDPVEFERLERQALRRRRVEALESLAHTAALFLAEYMTANKARQQAPAPSAPSAAAAVAGLGGESEGRRHDHGVDYAAAAAGMTAQMMMGLDDSGSDGDESDAGTISNSGRPGHREEDGDEGALLKKDARVGTAEEEEDDDDDDDDVDMERTGAGSRDGEEGVPVVEEQEQEGDDEGDANDDDDGAGTGTEMERLASEVKMEED